jgi:hypothetical protein
MERSTINTISGINILAGIWLIIAPFSMKFSNIGISPANSTIIGILVILFEVIRIASVRAVWASWVNAILGLWAIVSPFVMRFSGERSIMINFVIVGIVIAALSVMNAANKPIQMAGSNR